MCPGILSSTNTSASFSHKDGQTSKAFKSGLFYTVNTLKSTHFKGFEASMSEMETQ